MLLIALLWFYMFITTITIGFGIHVIYAKRTGINIENSILPIDYYIILGFIVITCFSAYFSLFFKIGLLANLIVVIISIIILILNFEKFKYFYIKKIDLYKSNHSILLLISFLAVIIVILLFAASSPVFYDTGLYHAQAIQWINNYSVIPGLGNLHGRLALNSHFFIISAFYDFSFLGHTFKNDFSLYSVGSFLLTILAIRGTFSIFKSIKEQSGFYIILHLTILLSSLWLFRKSISSPVPDTGVAIFIIYTLMIFVSNWRNINTLVPYILICIVFFIPTIKLSSIFIIILLPFLIEKINYRSLFLMFLFGFIIFLPFIIRNIILSGYLIYPFASIDLFNFDWKIPIEEVIQLENLIKNWAKAAGQITPNSHGHIPFSDWVLPWLHGLRIDAIILLVLNILSPFVFFFNSRLIKMIQRKYIIAGIVSILNICFCLITAPSLRFVYGFMIFNMALFLAFLFLRKFKINFKPAVPTFIVTLLIGITLLGMIKQTNLNVGQLLSSHLIFPEEIQKTVLKFIIVDSMEINVPISDDRCYNSPLPCSPYWNPNLHLRGQQLNNGFKINY